MAVLKPRERLVYFRISEDEFRQFVSVCEQAGARSVSDLARNAVQRLISDGEQVREDHRIQDKIQVLERLIAAVTAQLQLLSGKHPAETSLEFPNGNGGYFSKEEPTGENGRGGE